MNVLELVIYSISISGLSWFLQKCFEEDMIFHFYFKFITKLKEGDNKLLSFCARPLGTCCYCCSFWINTVLYPIIFGFNTTYILSIGLVYIFVELIKKIR